MAKIILEIEADPSGLAPAADAMRQLGKTADDLYTKLQGAAAAYKATAAASVAAAAQSVDAQGKATKSIEDFSKGLVELNKVVANGALGKMIEDLTNLSTSVAGLVTQLQTLTEQQTKMVSLMGEMSDAGLEATDAFNNLKQSFDKSSDTIEKTIDAIGGVKKSTDDLETGKKAVGELTDVFSAAKDSAEAFGVNTEYLTTIITTLNAVTSVFNVLMKIQAMMQKDSAASTAIRNLGLKESTIFTTANSLATSLASGVFKLFGVSVNTTSNSFKVLKGAIISTGIGALVVGIGMLVSAMSDLFSSTDDVAEAEKQHAAEVENSIAVMERENKLLEEQNQRNIDAAESKLKLAKANGDKEGEEQAEELVFTVKKDSLVKEMEKLKQDISQLAPKGIVVPAEMNAENIDATIGNVNDEIKKLEDAKLKVGDDDDLKASLDSKIKEFESFNKKLYDLSNKNSDMNKLVDDKAADDIADKKRDDEQVVKDKKKAADDYKKILKQQLDDIDNFYDQSLIGVTQGSAQELGITKKYLQDKISYYKKSYKALEMPLSEYNLKVAKLEDELKNLGKKSLDEQLKDKKDANDLAIAMTLDGSLAQLTAKIQALEDENKIIEDNLKATGIISTENKLLLINNLKDKAAIEKQILEKSWDNLTEKETIAKLENDISATGFKTQQQLLDEYNALKAKGYHTTYDVFLKTQMDGANIEKDILATGLVKQDQLHKDYLALRLMGYTGDYNAYLANVKLKVDADKNRLDAENAIIATGMVTKSQLQADFEEAKKNGYVTDYDNFLEWEQKKVDAQKELQEGMRDAALEIGQETISTIFEITNANRQAKFDAEMSALDKEKQAKLSNANLTEAQKEAINKQYDAKQKALKKKQWEADKKAKLSEAVVNGLMAVTKILAVTPPLLGPGIPNPGFIINLATTAATTALQIAKIASAPTPQFARGTRNAPPGFKWVGEEGPELINTPGGHAIITAPDSALISSVFDKYGLPSLSVPQFNAANISNLITAESGGSSLSLDYDQMGRSIAKHLPEGTKVNINMDKDGVHAYVVRSNARVNYNNNKFRFN